MAKNAYLIISDLHDYYKNLDNRVNYPGEIDKVKEKIVEVGMRYKELGYDVYAILLGDVFHRSYKNVISGILSNNYWILANKLFTKIYSVLGNHETSFYSSNPFFTLLDSIDSLKIQTKQDKIWQPVGICNVFNVVDMLQDGEVIFHFNHHGCPVTVPSSADYNIGLFHTDFVFSELVQASENQYHMNPYTNNVIEASNNELLELYDICFFGHHHKIYGRWEINTDKGHKCCVQHLASLGRPNVTEVQDNFLERDIPVVIVEDGKYIKTEPNTFLLGSREECVKESVLEEQHKAYERVVALKVANNYIPMVDDPVENIKQFCATDSYLTRIFEELIVNDRDSITMDLENDLLREGISKWN